MRAQIVTWEFFVYIDTRIDVNKSPQQEGSKEFILLSQILLDN